MGTSFLNQWFSGGAIKAICWTLIHSLWIGMMIALLAALVIMLTRKSSAGLRYRLLCGILVLFVLSVSVIFYIEVRSTGAVQSNPNNIKFFMGPVNVNVNNSGLTTPNVSPVKVMVNFLDGYLNIIFVVWLLFFIMKSLKMVSGLLYIQRIRNYKVHEVAEEFKHEIELFSRQIGIRQTVRLVQSELIKVPVAVGWLKPMILLPIGIIFQLTPEQLNGILWHELAHIRRRDYLVNILQGLVEAVFFFNPGLLWLSSLIRAEREACCDDLVLNQMTKKENYLEALLSFGFGEYKQARLAMGIGSGNQLRDRLKRMISQENKRLSIVEKSVLAAGLVLLTAFTTISKDAPVIKHITIKFSNKSGKEISKTMTETTTVSMQRLPGGQRLNDNKPATPGNHMTGAADTAMRFTSIMLKYGDADWANNDISAKDDKGNAYHFVAADGKIVSMELNGVKIAENKLTGYEYILQYIISEMMEKRRELDVQEQALAKQQQQLIEQQQHLADQQNAERERNIKEEQRLKALRADQPGQPMGPAAPTMSMNLQPIMESVIADLVTANVIADKSDLVKFNLTNSALMVNGKKQSEEIHKKLKAKYLNQPNYRRLSPGIASDPNFGLHFNVSGLMGLGVTDGPDSP